jgi:two-component system, response regulator
MIEQRKIVDILLIEDDPNDAELAIRQLNKHNLVNCIIHLKDGDAALSYFFDEGRVKDFDRPKVILLDLKLPKISGIEVLRHLKANPNTKKLPVIVMTSSQQQSDLTECYELGVNSYIVKPVEFTNFAKVIREVGLYWLLVNKQP